jgi:transaldolase
MKIFMDTANVEEIAEFAALGVVYGVTTNPSLIAKSGRTQADVIPEICKLIPGPVSAEVISTNCDGMVAEARKLVKIAKNVVVKIPCIPEGLKAVKILAAEGIRTNVTLVFSLGQAVLAARAGAAYVSPFIGRLDDIGENGVKLVEEMVKVFRNYGFKTEIIAASIRNIDHVNKVMLAGVDIATIPTKVLKEMLVHPLTDKGLAKFLEDYHNSLKK